MSQVTKEDLRAWLVERLASLRGIDPHRVDVRERFSRYGLDSLGAGKLLSDLSAHLGRPLMPTLVWQFPTIDGLASHLAGGSEEEIAPVATAASRDANEPIAIVGMACRLPRADGVEAYWRLLADGVDAITDVPEGRWDVGALFDPDPTAPGKLTTKWGGFLDQVDAFDPQLFGISPREAAQMDPQQRLVMELAWEAIEDAGIAPLGLKDSATSVFVGAMWSDYARVPGDDMTYVTQHTATGQDLSIVPARVSYALGLRGPSMAVNTACSSSLVAVHLARQSLLSGESTLALVGGVNLLLSPMSTLAMSKFGAMAPDGRSKAFDARANGYVRGEGAGVLVLERLSDAIANGHRVHAVLLGSALNNDGFSNGLTAPSPKAQELVVRAACASAGVDPARVQYVETHGTGTMLGDPIEAGALGIALGAGRSSDRPLVIGSVKTNIGHLESAAGIAGLLKVVLSLKRAQIPKSLHFQKPNPHIPFEALRIRVQTELGSWPETPEAPLAGVSSFGFGGTNAHVIVSDVAARKAHVLALSATTEDALRDRLQEARTLSVSAGARPALAELCAGAGRHAMPERPHRAVVTARSYEELAAGLDALLAKAQRPGTSRGVVGDPAVPSRDRAADPTLFAHNDAPVFVFAGQGSQWAFMGRGLLDEPAFFAAITEIDAALRPHLGRSMRAILTGDDRAWLDDTALVQPAIFAIQVAVARALRSWGIRPAAVVGQSMGEVAAAHVAGCLTLEDAALVICSRSRLVKRASGQGGMASVELSLEDARRIVADQGGLLAVAVSASPTSTVLSGDVAALDALLARLEAQGVFCRRVKVDYASHGPHMDPLREPLLEALERVRPRRSDVPFFSTVTASFEDGARLDAAYWWRNLREPVLFATAVDRLGSEGHAAFVEVGPHALLVRAVEQCAERAGREVHAVPTLRRDEDERAALCDAAGSLWTRGAHVDWSRVEPAEPPPRAALAATHLDASEPTNTAAPGADPSLLVLSAHRAEALTERAKTMAAFLRDRPGIALADTCYTAAARRSHQEHRLALLPRSRAEAASALDAFARGEPSPDVLVGRAPPVGSGDVVFVFPGQGSQWIGMGRGLLQKNAAFRASIEATSAAVQREAGFSILDELRADEGASNLARIGVIQPTLVAVEIALAAAWRAWGVTPACVIGHSMGEVAAAHVAGILSLEDAVKVICRRSRLLQRVAGQGAMALVELTLPEAEAALEGVTDRLSVAVSNAPRSTVISGDPRALEDVLHRLEAQSVFCRRVKVDVASHSPQMDPLQGELIAALADLSPRPAQIPMRSTVTGELVRGEEMDAAYWSRNLRAPVLFGAAVERAITFGTSLFLELSPHPILTPAIADNLAATGAEGAAIPSLRREKDEPQTLLEGLGALHVNGARVDWTGLFPDGGHLAPLPAYPFLRERLWLDPPAIRPRDEARSAHEPPLLGREVQSSLHAGEHLWTATLRADDPPYLTDHRVRDDVVLPGAAYVDMALSAARKALGGAQITLEDVRFDRMLGLPKSAPVRVQTALAPANEGRSITIKSLPEASTEWVQNARCAARRLDAPEPPPEEPIARLRERCPDPLDVTAHFQRAAARGLPYGPSFQGISEIHLGHGEALALLQLPTTLRPQAEKHTLHPALLDTAFQIALDLLPAAAPEGPFVPLGAARVRVFADCPARVWAHVRSVDSPNPSGTSAPSTTTASATATSTTAPSAVTASAIAASATARFDLRLLDAEGHTIAEVEGLQMAPLEAGRAHPLAAFEEHLYTITWRPQPLTVQPSRPTPNAAWLVVEDRGGAGAALADRLRALGHAVVSVALGAAFGRAFAGRFTVAPGRPADLDRLLQEAFGKNTVCLGAIHCACDAAPWADTTLDTLQSDLRAGLVLSVQLAQALLRLGGRDTPRLVLVTRGAESLPSDSAPPRVAGAPLWGFGRTLALEHPEIEALRVDLPPQPSSDEADRLAQEILSASPEDQVALREQGRFVARLVRADLDPPLSSEPVAPAGERPFRLEIAEAGTLDNLTLREIERRAPGIGEVEIEVEATGVNFRDVLLALAAIPDDAPGNLGRGPRLGMECSGRILSVGEGVTDLRPGQEVIALSLSAMASRVITRRDLVIPKPAGLSWEQAATLPIVFLTAYHSLAHTAHLAEGERVLIHAGAGGVGMAAIQWARHVGAEIFATASTPEKRDLLLRLGAHHALDSRSLSFADEIRRLTNGEGVDVVLNSLSGDFLSASLALLRPYGRFIEIGRRDYQDNRPLGLSPFLKSLTLSFVDLRAMMLDRPKAVARLLAELLAHFESGVLHPLPCRVFPASSAREAFSTMARAEHTGKLAIRFSDKASPIARRAPQTAISPDGAYLITGGLGGLGLSVASHLVGQGARQIALFGRRPPSEEASRHIATLESKGANILVLRGDVTSPADVASAVRRIIDVAPLRGVVHAAGLLDDRTVLDVTEEQIHSPARPKILGAVNLHEATRHLPLDFFILYSSVAGVLGSRGQAAYSAANAFLDAFARGLSLSGRPAMTLQWGPFSEVGLAAVREDRGQRMSHQGILSFTPSEGTALLQALLDRPRTEIALVRLSLRQWIESHPQASGTPYFEALERESRAAGAPPKTATFRDTLERAPAAEKRTVLEDHLLTHIGKVLRLDPSRIDRRAPFTSLGMDSLLSLELRNRLESTLGLRLSAALLFTYATPAALTDHLQQALSPAPDPAQSVAAEPKKPLPPEPPQEQSPISEPANPDEDEDALAQLAAFEEFLS